MEIGPGDEVVPANTYIATWLQFLMQELSPFRLREMRKLQHKSEQIEAAITPKTKAILAVHLSVSQLTWIR